MDRYPYHRYLRWLVLKGDGAVEICRHLEDDLGFIPPSVMDVTFLVETLRKGRIITPAWMEKCDVTMFEVPEGADSELDRAYWIAENEPAREIAQDCLMNGLSARHTGTILTMKFHATITERAVSLFRRGFWDTEELTALDFLRYHERGNKEMAEPPDGVTLQQRPAAKAWEHGIDVPEEELSAESIIRSIQLDTFMTYKQKKGSTSPEEQKESLKWASMALKASKIAIRKTLDEKKSGGDEKLPPMTAKVYIPEYHVPSIEDLEQPPHDDPAKK